MSNCRPETQVEGRRARGLPESHEQVVWLGRRIHPGMHPCIHPILMSLQVDQVVVENASPSASDMWHPQSEDVISASLCPLGPKKTKKGEPFPGGGPPTNVNEHHLSHPSIHPFRPSQQGTRHPRLADATLQAGACTYLVAVIVAVVFYRRLVLPKTRSPSPTRHPGLWGFDSWCFT